ncbi:LacI family transcriptional regulator [Bifidobacterium aquikefiri]|uniref:LacI family transcriptional regulator n=1 Tax=Bifidobacterium aquikefiri TaxID=1653207 RepID=A0A261G3R8_9BIFI|nr:LacI family transcriptional regulator [Bifidobacterium aquikefiri]
MSSANGAHNGIHDGAHHGIHNGKKRPSIFEVARCAGVSHQTVSRVINHSQDVSDSTRAKVQKTIDRLGYRPSNSARALASSRSRTIGFIAGGVQFYGPVSSMSAIESVARSHGLFMSVGMIDESKASKKDVEELCEMFLEQNVDAFIFLAPTDLMFAAACQARINQPKVIITSTHGAMSIEEGLTHNHGTQDVSFLGIDQWSAMRDVATLVRSLDHRTALYLAGPAQWRDAHTRRQAWQTYCRQMNIHTDVIQASSWSASEAYALMNHFLDESGSGGSSLPTVVVTSNDNQAIGASRAMHEHGIRIPQDMSLVGFDDMPGMDNLYPPLTTVHPHFDQLGTLAMREVLALLNEGPHPLFRESLHGAGLVPATLMKRRSLTQARGE